MSKIFKAFKTSDWFMTFAAFALLGLQIYCNLTLPEYMGGIVGNLTAGAMAGNLSLYWTEILKNGGIMLGLVAGVFVCTMAVSYLSARVITNAMSKIRHDVFEKVNNFSMTEINKFSIASLITRSTNDITQMQNVLIMVINMGLTAPVTAIVAVFKIINLSGELSIVTAISVVALLLIVVAMFVFVVPKFKKIQSLTDKVNLVTRENLTGIKVVRANSAEKMQEDKFNNVNSSLTKTNIFINRVAGIMGPGISFIMQGSALALVWLGAYLIADGKIDYQTVTIS